MATKKVKFYFFYSYVNGVKHSLKDLFENIHNHYKEGEKNNDDLSHAYAINLTSGPIRLRKIEKNQYGYYEMIFDRFQHTIPKISKIFSDSEELNIEVDEYISHEVSVIYDPINYALIVQRNINSLNERSIEFFINYINKNFYNQDADEIELAVIKDPDSKEEFKEAYAYKNLTFRTHGDYANGILEKIFGDKSNNLEYVEIKVVASRGKDLSLNENYVDEILRISNDENLQKLTAKVIIDEGDNISPIDFFEQKLMAIENFNLEGRQDLNAFEVRDRINNFYRERYSQIISRLR